MNQKEQLTKASVQLDRVLGFFPRVEAKATALFALNTGVLAILCINARPSDLKLWYVAVPAAVTLLFVVAGFFFLYRCSFPSLKGGHQSLIYFREIARRTENNYITEVLAEPDDDHLRDVLSQVWRNSEILDLKFQSLKISFVVTAIALAPWAWFLIAASVLRQTIPLVG